jgi:hypothetical protein
VSTSVNALQLAMLNAMAATGGSLHAAQVVLYKNNFDWTRAAVLGSLTLCDFDGYAAASPVAFNPAYLDPVDGKNKLSASSLFFYCTGSTTPNTVYGYAVLNTAGSAVEFGAAFDAPIEITAAGQAVEASPSLSYGD